MVRRKGIGYEETAGIFSAGYCFCGSCIWCTGGDDAASAENGSFPPPPETKAVAAAPDRWKYGEKCWQNKNGELKIYPASTTKILDLHHRFGRRKGKARPECRCHWPLAMGEDGPSIGRPSGYADQPASAALRHDAYFQEMMQLS